MVKKLVAFSFAPNRIGDSSIRRYRGLGRYRGAAASAACAATALPTQDGGSGRYRGGAFCGLIGFIVPCVAADNRLIVLLFILQGLSGIGGSFGSKTLISSNCPIGVSLFFGNDNILGAWVSTALVSTPSFASLFLMR